MSRARHTVGPWHVEEDAFVCANCEWHLVVGPRGPDDEVAAVLNDRHVSKAGALANAHLIAAAPELLDALEHLVRLLEPLEQGGGLDVPGLATLNKHRKALAKARGAS